MKFLIDVNASRSLGNRLVAQGYDVAYVGEVDPKMIDEDILAWAVREQRVILTTDNDFEQMIWGVIKSDGFRRSLSEFSANNYPNPH